MEEHPAVNRMAAGSIPARGARPETKGETMKLSNGCEIFAESVESSALDQIKRMCLSPAFDPGSIRIMPDVHAGAGSVIGFTAPLGDKIIPNVIGVDIGCGVLAIERGRATDKADFAQFDAMVRERVPAGFHSHAAPVGFDKQSELMGRVETVCEKIGVAYGRAMAQVGTLGGGNHFIELSVSDMTHQFWLLIHSGSRHFGLRVAAWHQEKARKAHPGLGDLAYLEGEDAGNYMADMRTAQEYAVLNRYWIAHALDAHEYPFVETVHNYIGTDNIIRKGAVSAREGEVLVIPWNMRDGSILGRGLGNADWNYSAPHGAGRRMGRSEAKKTLDMDEYRATMQGIFSTSVDRSTLDEAPMAYKAAAEIEACLAPTVAVVYRLRTVYNFKASE